MIPPIASRFVAGESPAEVLEHVRRINERDVSGIVNLLGEHYDDRDAAEADAATYRQLIDDIADAGLEAAVSVKPTQLGLEIGVDVFEELLEGVLERGVERGVFVWIDMEDHTMTDATLEAYETYARQYWGDGSGSDFSSGSPTGDEDREHANAGIGICVQANLKRTRADVERLADVPGKVRFVKGAYDEPPEISYKEGQRVNREYRELLEYAFEHFDGGIAVGSHDPEMIELATALHEKHGTDFEIQLLMGVREDDQFDLAEEYEIWQYVPYGTRWKSYFARRFMERKENLWFAIRALIGR